MSEIVDLAEQLITEEEERRSHVYPDNLGFSTIGVGACVDARVAGSGLCDAAIEAQLESDMQSARVDAAEFPHFAELDPVRQAVLISMAFQMGTKPLHWPNFMTALQQKDYVAAGVAGRDSDWWRTETHKRAEREMQMLESGNWVAKQ